LLLEQQHPEFFAEQFDDVERRVKIGMVAAVSLGEALPDAEAHALQLRVKLAGQDAAVVAGGKGSERGQSERTGRGGAAQAGTPSGATYNEW